MLSLYFDVKSLTKPKYGNEQHELNNQYNAIMLIGDKRIAESLVYYNI